MQSSLTRSPRLRRAVGWVLSALVATWASSAIAYNPFLPFEATPVEIAQMPELCQAKIGGKQYAALEHGWKARFGPVWEHMHHYCYGLKDILRMSHAGVSKQQRVELMESAIRNFDYVLSRAPPNFWFAPELHLQKGNAYLKGGKAPEAAVEYQRARPVQ